MYEFSGLTESDKRRQLFQILNSGLSSDPLDEILYILERIDSSLDKNVISTIHRDIGSMFKGIFPGFKKNNNKYCENLRTLYYKEKDNGKNKNKVVNALVQMV